MNRLDQLPESFGGSDLANIQTLLRSNASLLAGVLPRITGTTSGVRSATARMVTIAVQLGLVTRLSAVVAAVLSEGPAW